MICSPIEVNVCGVSILDLRDNMPYCGGFKLDTVYPQHKQTQTCGEKIHFEKDLVSQEVDGAPRRRFRYWGILVTLSTK
jgi:hypothetical protein